MENIQNLKKYLFATSSQKVLNFLVNNIDKQYTEKEITEGAGVKKSAVNLALRGLVNKKIIKRKKIGRTSLYNADENNFIIKEIKILQNILLLVPIMEKLKPESQKIIFFGSGAKGENTSESDIDIFVQSDSPNIIRKIINSSPQADKIQLIVKTPKDMLLINRKKPLFFKEIEKGKVLWENYEK